MEPWAILRRRARERKGASRKIRNVRPAVFVLESHFLRRSRSERGDVVALPVRMRSALHRFGISASPRANKILRLLAAIARQASTTEGLEDPHGHAQPDFWPFDSCCLRRPRRREKRRVEMGMCLQLWRRRHRCGDQFENWDLAIVRLPPEGVGGGQSRRTAIVRRQSDMIIRLGI